MNKKIIRTVLWAVTVLFLLNCRTLEVLLPPPTPTFAREVRTPKVAFAVTPTAELTLAPTERPTPTRRPTLKGEKVLPTFTPKPVPTNPPMTVPPPPTLSPWEYVADRSQMEQAPNCGNIYFKGKVVGANGNPINGVVVELTFYDNTPVKVSGKGEDPGEFGFTPLSQSSFHSPITFVLRLVRSENDRTAISEALTVNFVDCSQAGQFTKIRFKKVR